LIRFSWHGLRRTWPAVKPLLVVWTKSLTTIDVTIEQLEKNAALMRVCQTKAEARMEHLLTAWKIRFRCQWVVPPFIADFYLLDFGTLLEIDGSGHYVGHGRARDERRTLYLESLGYPVVRLRNPQVWNMTKETLLKLLDGNVLPPETPDRHQFHEDFLNTFCG
jgi:very-short-patch-repair endonuclease